MQVLPDEKNTTPALLSTVSKLILLIVLLIIALIAMPVYFYFARKTAPADKVSKQAAKQPAADFKKAVKFWQPAELLLIEDDSIRELALYGRELIAHTSKYLGPKGSVEALSNGMNCQNCHLQAGTAVFGNNFGAVAASYPKFRARSGTEEKLTKRIEDCFERSLNGKAPALASREMRALVTYIEYIGSNASRGGTAAGSGLKDLAFLNRAADPHAGKQVYEIKCQSCHQADGSGVLNPSGTEYTFPPLWGNASYNDGAGLFRLSNFARFAKYNMPQGATHENIFLSDEEAWDVAAYVNTQPRPHLRVPRDWPDIRSKPADHPFGPYADSFSEKQHKFGPFAPIVAAQTKGKP